jgi:hypothetical protein
MDLSYSATIVHQTRTEEGELIVVADVHLEDGTSFPVNLMTLGWPFRSDVHKIQVVQTPDGWMDQQLYRAILGKEIN